jgi:hypothetical protein
MCMSDDDALRALPRDTPDYHAHLRVLAQTAKPAGLKARLLEEADRHEQLADEELEALNAPLL